MDNIGQLYLSGLSMRQIAEKLDCSASTVRKKLISANVPIRSPKECAALRKRKSFPISKNLAEVINGELLGDGSIRRGVYQSNFSHHNCKKDYSEYIAKKFMENNIPLMGCGIVEEHYNNRDYYSIRTISTVEFHSIGCKWYKEKKIIPEDIKITPTTVLHWWLGDGSVRHGISGIICTDCFTKNELDYIKHKLNSTIGIRSRVVPEKNKYYRIFIPCKYMKPFLEYIGNSPVKSLSYKWNIRDPGQMMELIDINTEEFKRLYIEENKTALELAQYYGCSRCTVYEKAYKIGLKKDIRKSKRTSVAWDLLEQQNIIDLYKKEESIRSIIKLTGFSKKVINNVLMENGVKKYNRNGWLNKERED